MTQKFPRESKTFLLAATSGLGGGGCLPTTPAYTQTPLCNDMARNGPWKKAVPGSSGAWQPESSRGPRMSSARSEESQVTTAPDGPMCGSHRPHRPGEPGPILPHPHLPVPIRVHALRAER